MPKFQHLIPDTRLNGNALTGGNSSKIYKKIIQNQFLTKLIQNNPKIFGLDKFGFVWLETKALKSIICLSLTDFIRFNPKKLSARIGLNRLERNSVIDSYSKSVF